ncbi:hypothetical protein [Euzebya sp.]|uniref:hypothetical protein n=1 Tax=Euzebya sp. TaxID=1971409 RepID=UPI003513B0C6
MTSPRPLLTVLIASLALVLVACGPQEGTGVGAAPPPATEPAPTSDPPTTPDPDAPVSSAPDATICAPDSTECSDTAPDPSAAPCPPEGCTGEGPAVTYEPVEIVPTAQGEPREIPWESADVSADGTEVTLRWWSGVAPCTVLADVRVVETDTTVTITLVQASEHPPEADVYCTEQAIATQHTITLDAPLGDRELVDGAA